MRAVRILLVCLLAATAACSDEATAGARPDAALTVLAAASLSDVLPEIGRQLERQRPELELTFGFAGSQQLAAQIVAGAPADVFASADARQMRVVADAGRLDGEPVVLARNRLAIAVEPGNPRHVRGLADLADDDLLVVLAADEVPVGAAARDALAAAGVRVRPDSLETDVRAVLAKVALGEADAGLVYASDVVAADGDVDAVAIPDDHDVVVQHQIAVLADAANPGAARAFVEHARSEAARSVLADLGFGAP